jgi:hypothetical protein
MIKISRAGRVAQVVEHLPSKCKTLCSNPITAKLKNFQMKIILKILLFRDILLAMIYQTNTATTNN